MTLKLMLKNLKSFITGTPPAFLVIVLIEVCGAIGIIMTYGIIRNVFTEQEQETHLSRELKFERWRDGEGRTYWEDSDNVKRTFEEAFETYGVLSGGALKGRITLDGTEYVVNYYQSLSESDFSLGGVSYNEFMRGGNVVKACYDMYPCKVGDVIDINGTEYKVVATASDFELWAAFTFPYQNAPEGAVFDTMFLTFKDIPTKEQSSEIASFLYERLGRDYPIREPEIPDLLMEQFNSVMLAGCASAMILIVSNCITVYMYILRRRKNWLAVVKLCGCKNGDLISIFMSEMLLVSCLCFGGGYLIASRLMIPKMSRFYPLFGSVYTSKTYLLLFVGFILVSVIVMHIRLLPFVGKPVDAMRKGAA